MISAALIATIGRASAGVLPAKLVNNSDMVSPPGGYAMFLPPGKCNWRGGAVDGGKKFWAGPTYSGKEVTGLAIAV
jgi:hypothetical protein